MPEAFTMDVFLGKSFNLYNVNKKLFKYGTYLYVNIGVNNVLDNKEIRTGGFEQLRYDFTSRNPDRFANKYFYGYGANYFINVSLKF